MTQLPLFRVKSWINWMCCLSFYIFIMFIKLFVLYWHFCARCGVSVLKHMAYMATAVFASINPFSFQIHPPPPTPRSHQVTIYILPSLHCGARSHSLKQCCFRSRTWALFMSDCFIVIRNRWIFHSFLIQVAVKWLLWNLSSSGVVVGAQARLAG